MPSYRIFFRSGKFIEGRHAFDAQDDGAASMMAELLYEACSDRCNHFELWRGATKILPANQATPPVTSMVEQDVVCQHEELIRESTWTVAQSQHLLMRIRQLTGEGRLPSGDAAADLEQQRRLRMKAEELRMVAGQVRNPMLPPFYLRLAEDYELLAELVTTPPSGREKLPEL
jgi:hypothetical protein